VPSSVKRLETFRDVKLVCMNIYQYTIMHINAQLFLIGVTTTLTIYANDRYGNSKSEGGDSVTAMWIELPSGARQV